MKTIEITKQEALILATTLAAFGDERGNLSEEVADLLNSEVDKLEKCLVKFGTMSIEDTNQLIKKLILKGIAND